MAMNIQQAVTNDEDDLIFASVVKRENGNISDMTLWRWTRDPRIKFPPPDFTINNRKYWKRGTLRRHRRHIENLPKRASVPPKSEVVEVTAPAMRKRGRGRSRKEAEAPAVAGAAS
jgi:hypothetical protein